MKILVLLLLCSLVYAETYMGVRGEWVEAIATAYSPYDEIDKGRADTQDDFTADMTNFKEVPYGIATGSTKQLPFGTKIIVPFGNGYLDESRSDRVFRVDDTGGLVRSNTRQTGTLHIDLRYKTSVSALRFGKKRIFVLQEALNNFTFKNMDIKFHPGGRSTSQLLTIKEFRDQVEHNPEYTAKGGLMDTWLMNYSRAALLETLELKEEYHLSLRKIEEFQGTDEEFDKVAAESSMAFKIEAVDILHFIMSTLQVLGVDYNEFRSILGSYSGAKGIDGLTSLYTMLHDDIAPSFFYEDDVFADLTKYASEVMTSLPWKHWSKKDKLDRNEVLTAIMKFFMYWVHTCKELELSEDEVYDIYLKKNEVNFNRQKSGTYSEATKVDDVAHIRASVG